MRTVPNLGDYGRSEFSNYKDSHTKKKKVPSVLIPTSFGPSILEQAMIFST